MTTTQDAMEGWRSWMRAAGRPDTTVTLRTYQLTRVAAGLDLWTATTEDLAGWIANQGWSPETKRSWRAALIGFYRWAILTGRTTANPAADLPIVQVPRRAARPAPQEAIDFALVGADDRLWVMVNLAWRSGLRRGEISRVHGTDLIKDQYGYALVVHGKGGHERIVPLPADVAERVRQRCRDNDGWCFPGQIEGHLSPRRVGELVTDALPTGWTTHTLRHHFGTRSYAETRDLAAVQELLGHAKPETTRLYVQVDADALRAAASWAA